MFQFGSDITEGIAAFTDAEASFNIAAFTGLLPFESQFLFPNLRVFRGPAELWTIQVYAVRLAIANVFAGSEYRVSQHTLRIMSIGFPVSLHGILKGPALIEGVPTEQFDPQISVDVAHLHLGSELHRRVLLSPHDRTYPRLTEADDSVIDPVRFLLVHLPLLPIKDADDCQPLDLPGCQRVLPCVRMRRDDLVDDSQIPFQIIQLLPLALSDVLFVLLAILGKSVVVLLRLFPIRPRLCLVRVCEPLLMQTVYDPFCVQTGFVQQ